MYDEFYYIPEDVCECDDQARHFPTIVEWIDAAAREVTRRIDRANDGNSPKSLLDWTNCCEKLGIEAVGISKSGGFSAVIMEFAFDRWTIYYNSSVNAAKQSRFLAHELAEYMTRVHSWGMVAPQTLISGHHIRHLIARRVESLYFH